MIENMNRSMAQSSLAICVLLAAPLSAQERLPSFVPGAAVVAAVIGADWSTVSTQCLAAAQAGAPVALGLAGQAALWLGRSGEATQAFTALNDPPLAAAWVAFTSAFRQEQPGSAVAVYLHGDAQARVGAGSEALAMFDAAIAIDPKLVPAHVARAVVLAGRGDHVQALTGLTLAGQIAPGIAETHVAMATLFCLRRAASGAEAAARRALAIAPDHFLAHNVLGCALYGKASCGAASWDDAIDAFASAFRLLPLPLVAENARMVQVAAERAAMPGMDDAPWFRGSDFLDWARLAEDSHTVGTVMARFVGRELPAVLDAPTVAMLNQELARPEAVERLTARLSGRALPERITGLPVATKPLDVALKCRRLLELAYPSAIVQHDRRLRPGMQLAAHKWGVGGAFGFRADFSTTTIRGPGGLQVVQQKRDFGGVDADLSKPAVDRDPWLVSCWFGLLHSFPQPGGPIRGPEVAK